MPMPVRLDQNPGSLDLANGIAIRTEACADPRVAQAARRMEVAASTASAATATLRVECAAAAVPKYPSLQDDESYRLDVTPSGATLSAPAGAGALHGLATFEQLTGEDLRVPAVHIEDRPRFPWRGLMLDVSRHWMPLDVVKRELDAMAAVKLNVFHWHLSDDQGFRVESKRYPRFQERASDGHFYTQADIREAVDYARDLGIRVIPEFDIPGHTQSWLAAYPELATDPGHYEIGRTWGAFDPVMDPTREQVYKFLDGFLGEMAALFPDAYFHIGGDEVNPKQWKRSAHVRAFEKAHKLKDAHALQAYFNRRVQKILAKYGKTMIGWDEILEPDLPASIVIQSWRGQQSLADAASQGRRAILSWGFYLDYLRPASYHYGIDPLGGPAAGLSGKNAANVLGGEACMWAEYVNAETVDSRLWPRAAAIAERLWSPQDVTDPDSMYARLHALSRTPRFSPLVSESPLLLEIASPASALRVLAQASEALGLSARSRAAKNTSLTPLNRFVDAIPPESNRVWALEQAAQKSDYPTLREQFGIWSANDAQFVDLPDELRPLSQNLSALGAIGLRIVDYLEGPQPAPADWIEAQKQELARMEKPQAEVALAGVRPVRILLERLSSR
jgi:hexosaminidase